MRPLIQNFETTHTPESLVEQLVGERGIVLLKSGRSEGGNSRCSFVTARPFVTFRSVGSHCELQGPDLKQEGNPWQIIDELMSRFAIDSPECPYPLGGCFGYWGYDLKNFVESGLPNRAFNDLHLPDAHLGFYDSLVVFDHVLGEIWIISTGLEFSGARSPERAQSQLEFWRQALLGKDVRSSQESVRHHFSPVSNLSQADFVSRVKKAQEYIRAGDIYQVNLSHRLTAPQEDSSWNIFKRLAQVSPAPFAAYVDCGDFQLCSSSPELFLRMTDRQIETQPIKGTRPRSSDLVRDAQLASELQNSPKELAELVMITDLLRNDLGRVCDYGSIQVPKLAQLERFSQVQHLVATVTGQLQPGRSHVSAFAACFPGGSITGAPKIRAMQLIDELEPLARGPYTGAIGYLGFNRQSQLAISIRTAICKSNHVHFHVGAGIVADSVPEAEYKETIDKAAGFLAALNSGNRPEKVVFLNDRLVPEEKAVVSVFDRGFLYGDGLFETMRVENGLPLHWQKHMDRLKRGAEFLKLQLRHSEEQLLAFAKELIAKNEMPQAVLRLTLSRGVGLRGYSPVGATSPTLVMTLHPATVIDPENPRCWNCVTSTTVRLSKQDPLSQFKTANKLPQVLARAEAEAANADEALLLNTDGDLAEGTSSNLFWISKGVVHTPSLSCGVLPGITRSLVLERCVKAGIPVNEVCDAPKALFEADGVFMTLSTLGLVEVGSLDGKPLKRSPLVRTIFRAL